MSSVCTSFPAPCIARQAPDPSGGVRQPGEALHVVPESTPESRELLWNRGFFLPEIYQPRRTILPLHPFPPEILPFLDSSPAKGRQILEARITRKSVFQEDPGLSEVFRARLDHSPRKRTKEFSVPPALHFLRRKFLTPKKLHIGTQKSVQRQAVVLRGSIGDLAVRLTRMKALRRTHNRGVGG
jgi:hypothetical protein